MTDVERLDFDQLASTLRSWVGNPVRVLIAPHKPPDGGAGMVWAKLAERSTQLKTKPHGTTRRPTDPVATRSPSKSAMTRANYFVIYRAFFTDAWWVSREHRFLYVEMGTVQIGIEASVRN